MILILVISVLHGGELLFHQFIFKVVLIRFTD